MDEDRRSAEPQAAPSPRRLGVGMMVAAWVLLLGVLSVPFYGLLEELRNPNRDLVVDPTGAPEAVLERNRYGHYVAPGAINGRSVTFVVDTGATVISVPAAIAERIGLARGPSVVLETANGRRRGWSTRLERVEIGGIALRDVPAVINPGHDTDEVLLGMSFLKQLDFAQRGNRLTLRQPSAG